MTSLGNSATARACGFGDVSSVWDAFAVFIAGVAYAERVGARVVVHLSSVFVFERHHTDAYDLYTRKGRVLLDGVTTMSPNALSLLRASALEAGAFVAPDDTEHEMLDIGETYATSHVWVATTAGEDVRIDCASAVAHVDGRMRFVRSRTLAT